MEVITEDSALREYEDVTFSKSSQQQRRIWNGRRYVWRTVTVWDAGRTEPVAASTLPYVKEAELPTFLLQRKAQAVRVIEYIDTHGPQRLVDLHRALDIPQGTLQAVLERDSGLLQDEGKRWHLCDGISMQPPPTPPPDNVALITEHLRRCGPSSVNEIAGCQGMRPATVRNILAKPKTPFERCGTRYLDRQGKGRRWVYLYDMADVVARSPVAVNHG